MNSDHENRRSFRVREGVYLKYVVLSDAEFHEGLTRRKVRLGLDDSAQSMLIDLDARIAQTMFKLRTESEHLGEVLNLLNDKINVVVNQLPGLKKTKSELASLPPQVCEVSADGMVFGSPTPLPVDSKLYLQFLLESDNRYVETFCRVLRMTDPPDDADPTLTHGIVVEFLGMPPQQREILIQHMFNRETETLRLRRLQIESAES